MGHAHRLMAGGPPLQRWGIRIPHRIVSPTAKAMGYPSTMMILRITANCGGHGPPYSSLAIQSSYHTPGTRR